MVSFSRVDIDFERILKLVVMSSYRRGKDVRFVCASVLATNGRVDGGEVILEGSSRGKHLVFIRGTGQKQAGRWWWSLYTIGEAQSPRTSAPHTHTNKHTHTHSMCKVCFKHQQCNISQHGHFIGKRRSTKVHHVSVLHPNSFWLTISMVYSCTYKLLRGFIFRNNSKNTSIMSMEHGHEAYYIHRCSFVNLDN